ncbi:oleosin [Trifolium pratense]|uniref:Oleosin n=1 Tax=Trifolium pratense TaxID=57577 RepID=A0A2K3K7R7_TRIPR|nr:oleosin-like [Trifolium pratense]PNX61318.1 oleosin [Trifolium pratense]PNX62324.1 oleosin [Trifolium pratense]PNX74563.1 oleosin [Trifolium pratense]
MADLNQSSAQTHSHRPTSSSSVVFLRKLQASNSSTQLTAGISTLLVTGSIFLLLTGLSITGTLISLIFFSPLIILSSPIWVPVGTFFFLLAAGFLSVCGVGVVSVAASSWLYRYFRGLHPLGSNQVDYARSRIYDTATHVKDYAREYGGYLQSKDAAPGA